jgi:pimeloyl-ACP methyl ester carboxylesterase
MHGLLDALRVEKVYGIGHSAGAITLLHMAGQKPERYPALTLIAGAHRFSLEGLELLRHDHFEALDAEMQVCYRAIHPDGDAQIEAIFSRPRGLSGACREFSVPPAYLPAAKSRTLLVFGDRDEYFPMEIVTELARALPNAELWVVPGQGHTPVRPTLGGSAEAAQHFSTAVRKVFAKPEGFWAYTFAVGFPLGGGH